MREKDLRDLTPMTLDNAMKLAEDYERFSSEEARVITTLRDALLERTDNWQVMCLVHIREAVGDPVGRLMQSELVELVRAIVAERDALRAASKRGTA